MSIHRTARLRTSHSARRTGRPAVARSARFTDVFSMKTYMTVAAIALSRCSPERPESVRSLPGHRLPDRHRLHSVLGAARGGVEAETELVRHRSQTLSCCARMPARRRWGLSWRPQEERTGVPAACRRSGRGVGTCGPQQVSVCGGGAPPFISARGCCRPAASGLDPVPGQCRTDPHQQARTGQAPARNPTASPRTGPTAAALSAIACSAVATGTPSRRTPLSRSGPSARTMRPISVPVTGTPGAIGHRSRPGWRRGAAAGPSGAQGVDGLHAGGPQ